MDLNAYHRALNLGFSEREATKAGEDAWEDSQLQQARYDANAKAEYDQYCKEQEAEYLADMKAEAQP